MPALVLMVNILPITGVVVTYLWWDWSSYRTDVVQTDVQCFVRDIDLVYTPASCSQREFVRKSNNLTAIVEKLNTKDQTKILKKSFEIVAIVETLGHSNVDSVNKDVWFLQ